MKQNMSTETGVRLAMWLGILGMIAGIAWILLVPKPTAASVRDMRRAEEKRIQVEAAIAKKDFEEAKTKVVARTWSGGAEQVGPGALHALNALAAQHRVKLSGFRPERATEVSGLDFLPFSVTATGSYPDLVAFVKAIENPATKLAVDSLQIASSEANSDQVIATVGITAYRVSEETKNA